MPLVRTTKVFWRWAARDGRRRAVGRRRLRLPAAHRPRRDRPEHARVLGHLHHLLRVLHRHLARRHAHLGDPPRGQRRVAAVDHAVGRVHHRARHQLRRRAADPRPRPSRSRAEHLPPRAAVLAAALGRPQHHALLHGQLHLPLRADDPGPRAHPGPRAPPARAVLVPGDRLPRHAGRAADARADHRDPRRGRDPGRRLGPHRHRVDLRADAEADVAQRDLRPLLRGRRHLLGHRGAHHRDGDPAPRLPPRGVLQGRALQQHGAAAARDDGAVVLLHLRRAPHRLVRRRGSRSWPRSTPS